MGEQIANLNVFSEIFIVIEDLPPAVKREIEKLPREKKHIEIEEQ